MSGMQHLKLRYRSRWLIWSKMIQKIDLWQSQHPYFSGFATILILSPQIAEIRKNHIFWSACSGKTNQYFRMGPSAWSSQSIEQQSVVRRTCSNASTGLQGRKFAKKAKKPRFLALFWRFFLWASITSTMIEIEPWNFQQSFSQVLTCFGQNIKALAWNLRLPRSSEADKLGDFAQARVNNL